MIRKAFAILAVAVMAGAAFAAGFREEIKISGYLIDSACAAAQAKKDNMMEGVKGHPKSCSLMPNCLASGLAVVTDEGKVYRLDESGTKKAAELLKNSSKDKSVTVTVEGELDGDTITVKSISEG